MVDASDPWFTDTERLRLMPKSIACMHDLCSKRFYNNSDVT